MNELKDSMSENHCPQCSRKVLPHPNLELFVDFKVEVPKDFSLNMLKLGKLTNEKHGTIVGYHMEFTDERFPSELVPGTQYTAEVCRLTKNMETENLVSEGLAHGRTLGGPLGMALCCANYSSRLPRDGIIIPVESLRAIHREKQCLDQDIGDAFNYVMCNSKSPGNPGAPYHELNWATVTWELWWLYSMRTVLAHRNLECRYSYALYFYKN